MSKRVKIAVIREATLNAKPTDTHYLAEGGLTISRKDARALKGTTLFYEVLVDLGQVTGFDFIPGRDIPVYQTDSEPVLALDPQSLKLVDSVQPSKLVLEHPGMGPITMHGYSMKADTSILAQNAPQPIEPISKDVLTMVQAEQVTTGETAVAAPEAPVKRRPGRPKKVVAETPKAPVPELENEPVVNTSIAANPVPAQDHEFIEVLPETYTAPEPVADFEVTDKQDDESTFLIDPEGEAPTPPAKPEFSFEVDEDEAPPPPLVRNTAPQNLGFEVEDEEPAPAVTAAPAVKPTPAPQPINTDDFADGEPGLFDE